jgi:hypothetical protein
MPFLLPIGCALLYRLLLAHCEDRVAQEEGQRLVRERDVCLRLEFIEQSGKVAAEKGGPEIG